MKPKKSSDNPSIIVLNRQTKKSAEKTLVLLAPRLQMTILYENVIDSLGIFVLKKKNTDFLTESNTISKKIEDTNTQNAVWAISCPFSLRILKKQLPFLVNPQFIFIANGNVTRFLKNRKGKVVNPSDEVYSTLLHFLMESNYSISIASSHLLLKHPHKTILEFCETMVISANETTLKEAILKVNAQKRKLSEKWTKEQDPPSSMVLSEIKEVQNQIDLTSHLSYLHHKAREKFNLGGGDRNLNDFEKKVFFMHIPKTAGTTFKNLLYQQFDPNTIWPRQSEIAKDNKVYSSFEFLRNTPVSEIKKNRLMCGHFPFFSHTFFDERPVCIAFLRDPVERVISLLFHLRRNRPDTDLEKILKIAGEQGNNYMVRMFADQSYKSKNLLFLKKNLVTSDLELAKKSIDFCDFIGLNEKFDESVTLCEQLFGWHLGTIAPQNKAPNRKDVLITDDLRKQIREKNILDIELYNYGKQKFESLKKLVLNDYA